MIDRFQVEGRRRRRDAGQGVLPGRDFYTGGAHKWPCGPKEVSVLFVSPEVPIGQATFGRPAPLTPR
jgi:hypothetical protein